MLYKHLFGTEFQGHHALEDVKAKSKFLFRSSLQLHLYLFPKLPTSGTTDINSTIADMNFDLSHAFLKSFDGIIADPSSGGIMKKSKAKKFADS